MITRIKQLLMGEDAPADTIADDEAERRAVTAALLVKAALMDGHFDADERKAIEGLLCESFGLEPGAVHALIDEAEERAQASAQLFGFTNAINERFSPEERIGLIEMLWQVVYADGELHHYESNLMRRLAGLLHVTDRDSALARQRVLGE